jgi:hypothetical protein
MEFHMIGHASLFIRTKNLNVLMDPVLWDPHQEGLFDIYPHREVLHDRLPSFNLLVISHRHLDHFDLRSLASLPKNVPVLIPKDALMESYLRRLGFNKVTGLKDFSEVKIGATTLLTTRSENPVPEFGVVFADESGVFWNQVDSVVSPRTAETVLSFFPKIDFVLAAWQPMLETNFQTNSSLAFPLPRYSEVLYNIGLVAPRAVAPGANAFCCLGASSWLNSVVFPASRERFAADVVDACPSLRDRVYQLHPSDTVALSGGNVLHTPEGSDFVRRTGGDDAISLAFSPVEVDARLMDEGDTDAEAEAEIVRAVEHDLAAYIENHAGEFALHAKWKVIYQLEVVLPHGRLAWTADFSVSPAQIRRGRDPKANLFTTITGNAFSGLIRRTLGWDYALLGGFCRRFRKLYAVTPAGVVPGDSHIKDPLDMLYPYQELLTTILDKELERWTQPEHRVATESASR